MIYRCDGCTNAAPNNKPSIPLPCTLDIPPECPDRPHVCPYGYDGRCKWEAVADAVLFSRKTHVLKCESEYFKLIASGLKTFEVRRNDRGYKVGDIVALYETNNGEMIGDRFIRKEISYILHGGVYGIDYNYCILQLVDA